MADPVTGTTIGVGLGAVSVYGLVTGTDYGVVFGAFAGSVFYVATATDINRWRMACYFIASFIIGVQGAGLVGSKLAKLTHYSDRPLDALGAVLISALIIKLLTFLNNQDIKSLIEMLPTFRGGGGNGNPK